MLRPQNKGIIMDLSTQHALKLTRKFSLREAYLKTETQCGVRFVMDVCRAVGESAKLLKSQGLQGGKVRSSETTRTEAVKQALARQWYAREEPVVTRASLYAH